MEQIKAILNSNSFQSFALAAFIWGATFWHDNANITVDGFLYGFVGFISMYVTTSRAKTETIKQVQSGAITVTQAPAIVPVVEGGSKTTDETTNPNPPTV